MHERLHKYGKENRARIQKRKEEKEKRVLENCTFSPSVNKNRTEQAGHTTNSREPAWERLHRPCTKEDMLARLDRSHQDPDCTFRPKIIRRSVSAGRQRPVQSPDIVSSNPGRTLHIHAQRPGCWQLNKLPQMTLCLTNGFHFLACYHRRPHPLQSSDRICLGLCPDANANCCG